MNILFIRMSLSFYELAIIVEEEFEDTKGVIRIRKSKKDRQHNGQIVKDKGTNNDLQNIQIKHSNTYNN